MRQHITFALIGLLLSPGCAARHCGEIREDFQPIFERAGVAGTIVARSLNSNRDYTYNKARAKTGFVPASTFKVLNSLIALENGAVADAEEILAWDGIKRGWDKIDRNLSMRLAIKYSAVWFYQEMARRIGAERMQAAVDAVGYGNKDISGGIDLFWLEGGLRISAVEQVEFLTRLYHSELPFSQRSIDIVKDILIYEQTDSYTIRAKTGWARRVQPEIGWWVGYVETTDDVYVFALNIDIVNPEDRQARFSVVKDVLTQLGALPE